MKTKSVYIIAPSGYYTDIKHLRERLTNAGYRVLNQALEVPYHSIELADRIVLDESWTASNDCINYAQRAAAIGKTFLSRKLF